MKSTRIFHLKVLIFSVVKFSIYLNRRVCFCDVCKLSPYKSYFRWGLEGWGEGVEGGEL